MTTTTTPNMGTKSFWKRPEGVTGTIFLAAILLGGGYALYTFLPALVALAANTLYLVLMLMALAALLYIILDPKMRNLIWYMYKSMMRWVTGVFVQIDPIGILKSYVEHLQDSLGKMSKQIGNLKGQMRKMETLMQENQREIENNLKLASVAKNQGNESQVILATRKAARLEESNEKYSVLHQKMQVLYRILDKMYKNSEILLEDTRDQVTLKEQERKAIRASHGAMRSAMSVISGDPDKRAMFDAAVEHIADDVAMKVGEMERFMEVSANFMDSMDLQNGVFQAEGMEMLEKWEKESTLMLLSGKTAMTDTLDLNASSSRPEKQAAGNATGAGNYDGMFN